MALDTPLCGGARLAWAAAKETIMRLQLVFLVATASLAGACGGASQQTEPRPPVTTSASVPAAAMTDAQIVAVTGAANSAEVEQGQLAAAVATDPRVRAFAHHMIRDHRDMMNDQSGLEQRLRIAPEPNDTSSKVTSDATQTLDQLKNRSGNDFDRAYIASQIKGHKDLLNTIDTRLLPNAHDSSLRDHLRDVREKVKGHLEEAQFILGLLPH
jgi:putative membrane protein